MQATITKTDNTLYYGETQVNVYQITEKSWRGDRVSYFIKDPTCHNGYLKVKEKNGNFTITDTDVTAKVNGATMLTCRERIEFLGYSIDEKGQITAKKPGENFYSLAQVPPQRQLYYDDKNEAVYYLFNNEKRYIDQSRFVLHHSQGNIKLQPPQPPEPKLYQFNSNGGDMYHVLARNHGLGLYELLDEQGKSLTFNGNPLWFGEAGASGNLPGIFYLQQLDFEKPMLTESELRSLSERKPLALVRYELESPSERKPSASVKSKTAQGTPTISTQDLLQVCACNY